MKNPLDGAKVTQSVRQADNTGARRLSNWLSRAVRRRWARQRVLALVPAVAADALPRPPSMRPMDAGAALHQYLLDLVPTSVLTLTTLLPPTSPASPVPLPAALPPVCARSQPCATQPAALPHPFASSVPALCCPAALYQYFLKVVPTSYVNLRNETVWTNQYRCGGLLRPAGTRARQGAALATRRCGPTRRGGEGGAGPAALPRPLLASPQGGRANAALPRAHPSSPETALTHAPTHSHAIACRPPPAA